MDGAPADLSTDLPADPRADSSADLSAGPRSAAIARYDSLGDVMRDITRGALAGMIAGALVVGPGGRLVMRLAAPVDPDAVGLLTENGNRIGDITIGGTIELLLFGGLLAGLFGSVVWVTVSPWIPGNRWARALLAMPVAVAIFSFRLIEADNPDFRILHPPRADRGDAARTRGRRRGRDRPRRQLA